MKKKPLTMWALWNYDVLFDVSYRRKDCREYANKLLLGGKTEADKLFRKGSFRISKVVVREVK